MPGVGIPGFLQWVRATKESVWGVRPTSPAADDVKWFRITGDTNFHPTLTPARTIIRTADAYNRPAQVVSSKFSVAASLATPFYPTQAQFLLDAAMFLSTVDASHPIPLQPTYTLDHYNGVDVRSYHGCICSQLAINSSAGPMEVSTSSNWIGRSVVFSGHSPDDLGNTALTLGGSGAAGFGPPDLSVFPSELPFNHQESVGLVKLTVPGVAQAVVANYDSFNITIANDISARHYENAVIGNATWCGRDVSIGMGLLMLDTTWRKAYENQVLSPADADLAIVGGWTRAGTPIGAAGPGHTVVIDYQNKCRIASWDDSRPLGDVITQQLSVNAMFSLTHGTDLQYTVDGGTTEV